MIYFVFLFSLLLTAAAEALIIPRLKKTAAQPIYIDGPSWHLSKSGTPTMGGIGFILGISITLALYGLAYKKQLASLGISLLFALSHATIGLVDDLAKLRKKENAGLSPYEKLLFQFLVAILFLMARRYFLGDETTLYFSNMEINMGWLYYPIAVFIILGATNCANLTDGIDGLASSVALVAGLAFILLANSKEATIAPICAALIGGTLAFLLFNRHPAKIFMGDTGSLFLGGLITSLAFSFGNPTVLLFVGGVYVIEGISVILQVIYFRLTKKRLFKMAPIHHHLERCGLSENKICIIAVCITILLSAVGAILY